MADTIREQILQAVVTRLKTITVANGFNLDIGDKVFRARPTGDDSVLPWAVLWDSSEAATRQYGLRVVTMDIVVEILSKYTLVTGASQVGNQALGDILKAMPESDAWGGLARDTKYQAGQTAFPSDGDTTAGVKVSFSIEYTTGLNNPYAIS